MLSDDWVNIVQIKRLDIFLQKEKERNWKKNIGNKM
jgi:hypothetical protein